MLYKCSNEKTATALKYAVKGLKYTLVCVFGNGSWIQYVASKCRNTVPLRNFLEVSNQINIKSDVYFKFQFAVGFQIW